LSAVRVEPNRQDSHQTYEGSCHTGGLGATDRSKPPQLRLGKYADLGEDFDALFEDIDGLTALEGTSLHTIFQQFGVRTVLDCACGTGIQALGVAQLGYEASASDISPRMIGILETKARQQGLAVATRRQDFRALTRWPGKKFDAVICCGESLPLVQGRPQLVRALARMVGVAAEAGGIVVVGLHNYALLRDINEEFRVQRPFSSASATVAFDTRLFGPTSVDVVHTIGRLKEGHWQFRATTVKHLYVTAAELRSLMLDAGCQTVRLLDVTGRHEVGEAEWVLAVGTTAGIEQ
jgi:glycine/sarcosine N-methyltransferase